MSGRAAPALATMAATAVGFAFTGADAAGGTPAVGLLAHGALVFDGELTGEIRVDHDVLL
jgi:hypothetical protein